MENKNTITMQILREKKEIYQESYDTNLQAEGPVLLFFECDKKTLHHLYYLQKTDYFCIK